MLHFLCGIGLGRTLQTLRGQIDVLQVFEVFEDRLAGVEGLGASGLFGQKFQTPFDFGIESDGEQGGILLSLYTYIKRQNLILFAAFAASLAA